VLAISGAIAASLIRPGYAYGDLTYPDPPTPVIYALVIPLLASLLAGAWNGFLVAYLEIQPIVATLILMVAGRGIAQLITRGQIVIFIHESFERVGGGFFLGFPFPVFLVVLVFNVLMNRLRRDASAL